RRASDARDAGRAVHPPGLGFRDQVRRLPAPRRQGGRARAPRVAQRPRPDRCLPGCRGGGRRLPYAHLLIDGEVVVHGPDGLPSFAALQQRGLLTRRADIARAAVKLPATLYAFDLPLAAGHDVRALPLLERKRLLATILPTVGAIRFSEHIAADGERMFAEVGKLGVEGIVGKRADSAYVGRRSSDWIKISARTSDEFAVVGCLPPKSGRQPFGALLLAQRTADGWRYAGRVGSGFSARDFERIGGALAAARPGPPPAGADDESRDARWLEASAVVEVRFKSRGTNG